MSGPGVIGVDVGGTFTDVVLADGRGRVHARKVPTTPDDPRLAVAEAVAAVLADAGVPPESVGRVVHGTTLATNVILERRGARVAFVTTAGFGDLLRLGREARVEEDRYDLFFRTPDPPVEHALTFEVPERIGPRGEVIVALGEALALGDVLSVPRDIVLEVLAESPIGPAVASKRASIESGRYPPRFKLRLAAKDLRLVTDEAVRGGRELPLARAAREWLDEAVERGDGDLDYSAVVAAIIGESARA